MSAGFPRLPTFLLERRRLLDRCALERGPVTILLAAPGFGKTVLATQFALQRPEAYEYLALRYGEDEKSVRRRVQAAMEQSLFLVIDDAHAPADEGRAALRSIIETFSSPGHVLVCARSAEGLVAPRSTFDGSINLIQADDLALSADEAHELCEKFGVRFERQAMDEFLTRTAGWPIAAAGALRTAGLRAVGVDHAIEAWHAVNGSTVARFITEECARTKNGAALLGHLQHPGPVAREMLAAWSACGLFTIRSGRDYRVIPVAYGVFGNQPHLAAPGTAAMRVALLNPMGAAWIGEEPICWVRRKDAQIVKYLVLKGGAATRTELMEIFWPGRDRNIAAQNLRTSCSNIRRAIRAVVGPQYVERFFESKRDLRICAAVLTDVERFRQAMASGRGSLAAGDVRAARMHFKAARELHEADLMAGMPSCGFEQLAASLRADFVEAVHRLRALPDFSEPRANAS